MYKLDASVIDDIETASFVISKQAVAHYNDWKAGKVYISRSALRAMGRRYLYLRDREELLPLELWEFGRLFAFFSLAYPADDIPSAAAIAIDFCNLINSPSPTEVSS